MYKIEITAEDSLDGEKIISKEIIDIDSLLDLDLHLSNYYSYKKVLNIKHVG